jgi:hypothetical protein
LIELFAEGHFDILGGLAVEEDLALDVTRSGDRLDLLNAGFCVRRGSF